MSSSKRTIAVLGALGAQGGSVVSSLIEDGSFNIRAVTRSVDSDAAKALKEKGVEIVAGDTKKPDSLMTAFEGADSAFIVVNFWDPEIMTKEEELTKEIIKVAKTAGVEQILYASLANVEEVSKGSLEVPHFTMKAKVGDFIMDQGFKYVTFIEAAAYYSNWFTFFKPTEEEDGTLVWKFPGKQKISQFDPNTGTGGAAVAAAKDPAKYNGAFLLLEGDSLTPEETVALIGKKMGKETRVDFIEPSVFATFFPGANELAEMTKWFDEYGYYGPETDARKRSSGKDVSKIMTMQEWLDTGAYEKLL